MRYRSAIALLVLVLAALVAPTAPVTAADSNKWNCDDFDHSISAISQYRSDGGPLKDPNILDEDRDGNPCESLAPLSEIEDEPDCYDKFGSDNCTGRDQFREIYWLTFQWGVAKYDEPRVKAALIHTFGPQATKNGEVNSFLALIHSDVNSSEERHCAIDAMLAFVDYQNDAEKTSSAFVTLFTKLKSIAKKAGPAASILKEYMKAGGKLAKTASSIVVSENAKAYLADADC